MTAFASSEHARTFGAPDSFCAATPRAASQSPASQSTASQPTASPKRRVALTLVLLSVAWVAAPLVAATVDSFDIGSGLEGWTIDRFNWQEPLGSTDAIAVDNRFGNVHARASKTDDVEVLAVSQHADGEAKPPTVTVSRVDRRIEIEVAMPEGDRPDDLRRVDLTVFVPASARLVVRTEDGLVDAKKLGCDIEATSVRGKLRVSTAGSVDLRSEHGDVVATLLSDRWPAPPRLETVTGGIELWLPEAAAARVEASTGGLLTTDFSLEIEHDRSSNTKHAVVDLAGGPAAATVQLVSAKGEIRILRSPIR